MADVKNVPLTKQLNNSDAKRKNHDARKNIVASVTCYESFTLSGNQNNTALPH